MNSARVLELLREQDLTIAFAESMTGGYASYQLIKNPGASTSIKMSVVAYSIEAKEKLLGIPLNEITKYSVVSTEIALMMAKNIRKLAKSDVGVGVTGNAGPTTQENTEDSVAYIGIANGEKEYVYRFKFFDLSREEAINKCVKYIYDRLEEILEWIDPWLTGDKGTNIHLFIRKNVVFIRGVCYNTFVNKGGFIWKGLLRKG